MSFKGKVALVTGAASGIGKAVAELYAKQGASVVLADTNQEAGERAAQQIRKTGEASFVSVDVSQPSSCAQMVETAMKRYGRLDNACNCAGILSELKPTADHSIEDWQRTISINLSGIFYSMKYQITAMLENGGGSITNMASVFAQVGVAGCPGYVAAKHAVLGLTKNAALEYAGQGIRVNAVAPGYTSTPLIEGLENNPAVRDYLVSQHPIGRLGRPEEVAELVMWLSSDKACFVTGACYAIDGGYLAR